MNYSDLLAATCIAAKMGKQAADPLKIRSEFEDAAAREEILREHADRMQRLAKEREENEPQNFGSYVGTTANSLLNPIPGSLPEAVIRGTGMGIGGALGSSLGASRTGATPEVISAVSGSMDPKTVEHFRKRLMDRGVSNPDEVLKLLKREKPYVSSANLHLDRGAFKGHAGTIREELANTAKQLKDFKSPKRWRVGGSIAGAIAGGAVTGLPFAIKAVFDKLRGGEGALNAKAKMEESIAQSQELQHQREKMLRQLDTAHTSATNSEGVSA